jgi:transposase
VSRRQRKTVLDAAAEEIPKFSLEFRRKDLALSGAGLYKRDMEHGRPESPDANPLERRVRELETLVSQQQATIEHYHEQLERAIEQMTLLKKALFSPRRERYVDSPDQKRLFTPEPLGSAAGEEDVEDVPEKSADEEPPATSASSAEPARDRCLKRRRKRIVFPQFLPRQRKEYPLPPDDRPCGNCGTDRVVIQTRVTEQLEIEPPNAYVVEHVRYTYACPSCREGDQVVTTQKPPQAVDKSPFGASILAWLVVAKFVRHLPVYRHQEMLLGPLRLWLSRPLLCGLLRATAEALRPLEARLREYVLASALLQADETPVRFLGKILGRLRRAQPGRAALGYVWAYAGDNKHPYVFYDFQPTRSRDGPEKILPTYEGYLQTDGYAVYTGLVRDSNGRMRDVACWAHARRHFDEARYTTSHPLVHEGLAWIQQLYDVEDRTRDLPPDQRLAVRLRESAPIGERMRQRFLDVRPELRPTSKLAEAIDYMMNRWKAFKRFLEDGRIPLDTNCVERLLRPVAIGRKNFLFFGSLNGGRTAATLYTIVQSARRNNVDVLPYLTDVLRRLPAITADDAPPDQAALDALLPDRWAAAHPEHVLAERVEESREALARRRHRRVPRRLAAT